MAIFLGELSRQRQAGCDKRGTMVWMRHRRRNSRMTWSVGALVLAMLLPPATSTAAATIGDESLEARVTKEFVAPRQDVSDAIDTPAGIDQFPACRTGTITAYAGLPRTSYRTCLGEVRSWDWPETGMEFDARVSFPCVQKSAEEGGACVSGSTPLPLVLLMGGWAGNRNDFRIDDPTDPLSTARFLAKGYAVLLYTPRGFQASCGSLDVTADVIAAGGTDVPSMDGCLKGHTHIAERDFEGRDSQHLLGMLVDAGVADPQRLAAHGGSYGGGQSWLLATTMPWATPKGRTIQLAAAAPFTGWTDLYSSLAPNGRATDGIDQSASREEPFGVVKPVIFNEVYRYGRLKNPHVLDPLAPTGGGRYNTTYPDELHSYMDGWAQVFNAGEPHDSDRARALPGAFRGKSAYYPVADPTKDYLTELAARRVRPVPIFAVQGWTDPFFPAVEALQMYRKLKASHPGYPIHVLLGDLGHNAQSPAQQLQYAVDQASSFIDTHLGVITSPLPPVAASFPTLCAPGDHDHVVSTGDNWDVLAKEKPLTFSSDASQNTDSVSSNIGEEVASDPVLVSTQPPGEAGEAVDPFPAAGGCVERDGGASASGASWRWKLDSAFTMLGLPTVSLPYEMQGQDATVVAKLWDVAPDGKKLLVTRGVYRLTAAPQAPGSFKFQLFGNHWRFAEGHTIELEVGQRDLPFLRPDNLQSSISYPGVQLSVPQAKT